MLARFAGDLTLALDLHGRAHDLSTRNSNQSLALRALLEAAEDSVQKSEFDSAFTLAHRVFQEGREMRDRRATIQAQRLLGRIQELMGLPSRALRFYVAARKLASRAGYRDLIASLLSGIARSHFESGGDPKEGARLVAKAVERAESSEMPEDRLEAYLVQVEFDRSRGHQDQALSGLIPARQVAEGLGLPYALARVGLSSAQVTLQSDPEAAAREAAQVVELAGTAGTDWILARAYAILARLQSRGRGYQQKLQEVIDRMASGLSDENLSARLRRNYDIDSV